MMRVLSLASLAAGVSAASYTWLGIDDNQWTTPNNWSPGTSTAGPGDDPSDEVTIDDRDGGDALVELLQPRTIARLNVGDALSAAATLRLLDSLSVTESATVGANGAVELNAGKAALSCPNATVTGWFQFYSGTVTGSYKIKNPGMADLGSANFQGAKVFDAATVDISTSNKVTMGGTLQFGSNGVITSSAGLRASGRNFTIVLMNATSGTGNSATFPDFSWSQTS